MSVELTSFELLTLAADHPLKLQYQREQTQRPEWRTDFCRARTLGAVCLECTTVLAQGVQVSEDVESAA